MKNLFLLVTMLLFTSTALAQSSSIKGIVVNQNDEPVRIGIRLEPYNLTTTSNSNGEYSFVDLLPGDYKVIFNDVESTQVTLGRNQQIIIPTYTLTDTIVDEDEALATLADLALLETNDETTSVSSLLTASNDVFMNKAGFQFGSDVFFKIRGYNSKYSDFMLNGVRFKNPETGWQPFNLVGGLNDILRYRETATIGSNSLENGFGEIGGTVNYNLRPSEYGKGGRITYSNLNRSYNNRIMGTYASGDKNGISYVVSGSKRWANDGYVDGNYYDAYAGYAAVEGKVSDNYSVMISAMASPRRRATHSIHTQEAYDLAGTNFYSADWGYQNGEKRNARLRKNYNPLLTVSNYIDISPATKLQVTGTYMTGFNLGTRIERQNAANPDPDYFRNMPSNSPISETFTRKMQLDWQDFYKQNLNNTEDDGYNGIRAKYILEENVRDDIELQAVAQFNTEINNNITLNYGANFRHFNGNYYKRVNDLLGADYWLNVDSFNNNINNNDEVTDTRVYQDDKFGYDYDLNEKSYDGYIQGNFSFDKVDAFASATIGSTDVWRKGNISNGHYSDISKGKGEVKNILTYGAKAGATYKIDGRNYVSTSGMYYTTPPNISTMFLAPSSIDTFNDRTNEETVYGGEASFNHKSPKLKLRLTGYGTRFNDQSESLLAYVDGRSDGGFARFFVNEIDKLHIGGELGFDYALTTDLSVSGAGALGKYTYMSRPIVSGYQETNATQPFFPENSSFLLDFYESNTPQTAANLGLTYRGPARFILNLDGNYYANSYVGPSAYLRTIPIAEQLIPIEGLTSRESLEQWRMQERLPEAFRLNLSLYKEIRFSYDKQIGINASVSNLLDDKEYPNLAFEQFRTGTRNIANPNTGVVQKYIDPSIFPTRYRYAYGRTYFINIAYKFR